jgi:hypothetical protein
VLYINGEFYGIGDFLYNSSRKDYNIAKNSPEQIMIIWDGAINIPALTDNGTWVMDSPSKPTAETAACLDRWRDFAQSAQDAFTAAAGIWIKTTWWISRLPQLYLRPGLRAEEHHVYHLGRHEMVFHAL